MSSHSHHHDEPHTHSDSPIEMTDANIPLAIYTTLGILITVVLCMVIVFFQFRFEEAMAPKPEPGSVFSNNGKLPPLPRLQAQPAKDLVEFKEQQKHQLESFGWVDKDGGVAHVPIDKGIEMILKNGMPIVKAQPAAAVAAAKPKPATVGAAKQE